MKSIFRLNWLYFLVIVLLLIAAFLDNNKSLGVVGLILILARFIFFVANKVTGDNSKKEVLDSIKKGNKEINSKINNLANKDDLKGLNKSKPRIELELKEIPYNWKENGKEVWKYNLIIRNNSSYTAYNLELICPKKLSHNKINELDKTILATKGIELEAKHNPEEVINSKKISPFPPSLLPLTIKVHYTNEERKKFTTIFSVDSVENGEQKNEWIEQ